MDGEGQRIYDELSRRDMDNAREAFPDDEYMALKFYGDGTYGRREEVARRRIAEAKNREHAIEIAKENRPYSAVNFHFHFDGELITV